MSKNILAHYPFTTTITVRFRDLDALGHVNHAVYLTYFETARIAYYGMLTGQADIADINMILVEITATYHAPARLTDELSVGVRVARIGTKSFDMEYLIVRSVDHEKIASGRSVQVMYDYQQTQSIRIDDAFRMQVTQFQQGVSDDIT
ncbi:MAG: thioesterase family protein [Chloroflexota bacterium]